MKILLFILLLIPLLILTSYPAWATTWYVRDGGGNTSQCTGTTNATYPGSGSGVACAYSNPGYVLGYFCTNFGGSCPGGEPNQMVSGDTLYIDGDSDVNSGQQAVYQIGYGSPQMPACTSGDNYDCTLGNLPAGISSGSPTTVSGTGTHKPMLLGVDFPYEVFNADNNYLTVSNLEITDNQNCAYSAPVNACRYEDGIWLGGTGIIFNNIYAHGLTRYGVIADSMGSATFNNLWAIGNGFGGMTVGNDGATSVSGTLTFNQPIIEWNGCEEAYPLTGGIDNPSNYSNCFGQASSGYGDGLAFGANGNQNAGNWTIIGPGSISFNTQDGLDTLHGTGNGTLQVDKMRFEGNAGNQVKLNGLNEYLTNSIIVGDCGWWYGAAQSASGAMLNGDSCRAYGNPVHFNVTNGSITNIYNNTIFSNGATTLESKDQASTGCNGATAINVNNNIIIGGYAWWDDATWQSGGGNSFTLYLYNDGNDGNGGGTCGNLTWTEDYNLVTFSDSNCVGSHDKCNTSSGITGTLPIGTAGGGANTYYQGTQGVLQVRISSGSAAKGAGVTGLSYWNTSNDYYNNTRASPPSIGGLEYLSLAANTFTPCFYNADCASNICTSNVCTGTTTITNQGDLVTGNMTLKGSITFK